MVLQTGIAIDPSHFLGDFIFKEAGPGELPLALGVRRAVYVDELRYEADRILIDPFDRRAHHFLATTREGKPVGAMRLLTPDARPFEFEHFVDASTLLAPDTRPGEISRMCILAEFRAVRRRQFIHAGLWKICYEFAVRSGLSELWVWATPTIAKVYEYMGFRNAEGTAFQHPAFRFQRYQLLHLNVLALEAEYRSRCHPFGDLLFPPKPVDPIPAPGSR